MRWVGRIGVIGALVVGGLVLGATPAAACSCARPPSVTDAMARADGAFVGTLVEIEDPDGRGFALSSGRIVFNRFEVEAVAKGAIGPEIVVQAAAEGATCGLETEIGQRVGLTVRRKGDGWASSLCNKIDPERLAAISGPPGPGPPSELLRNVVTALLISAGVIAFVVRAETRHDPESPKQSGS